MTEISHESKIRKETYCIIKQCKSQSESCSKSYFFSFSYPEKAVFLIKKSVFLLFFLILGKFFLFTSLETIEIRLKSPHKIYSDQTHVYMDAEGSSTIISPETLLTLKYNIPITVTYYLELHQQNFLGFSSKQATLQIVNRINYDLWSESYIVEKAGTIQRFPSIETLQTAIVNLKKVPIARVSEINPDRTYFIKSRVVVKIKNSASYYDLFNNLLSIFKYRTTYYNSQLYRGQEILVPLHNPLNSINP